MTYSSSYLMLAGLEVRAIRNSPHNGNIILPRYYCSNISIIHGVVVCAPIKKCYHAFHRSAVAMAFLVGGVVALGPFRRFYGNYLCFMSCKQILISQYIVVCCGILEGA